MAGLASAFTAAAFEVDGATKAGGFDEAGALVITGFCSTALMSDFGADAVTVDGLAEAFGMDDPLVIGFASVFASETVVVDLLAGMLGVLLPDTGI